MRLLRRAVHRKLLRELWHVRGQMLSIALVVATGIMTVITMRGGYDALAQAQQDYYRDARFADIWASLERAPEPLRQRLEYLPGIAMVDTRVRLMATLDLPHLNAPAQGLFVSVPEQGRPRLNDLWIREGRYIAPGAPDEVIVSENFASANGYRPGARLRAVINGRARTLRIVGIAISPEHAYPVAPGSLFPDDERYGIFWMSREELGPAYDMDGAFNEVVMTLAPGANPDAVMAEVDRLLEPYGGLGAYPREDQPSHQILKGELDQNRVMGTAVPAVFLLVAAFLLNIVLGRLITTQRGEIAVLKAFGYRSAEIGWHYLTFAMVAVLAGALLGTALGTWLGTAYIELYGQYFDFPDLRYRLRPELVFLAFGISVLAASLGALGAVRRAAELPPAEAMQPAPPARFKPGWLERLGIGRALPAAVRMIVRNMERKPVQSLLSAVGVSFAVAILVLGLFMYDGMGHMMSLQFREIQREDLNVSFVNRVDAAARFEIERLAGVRQVEAYRTVPVRITAGHRQEETGLQGIDPDGELRRVISAEGLNHPLPADGVILSARLAAKLSAEVGDRLHIEVLEGRRAQDDVRLTGIVEDFLGLNAYVSRTALQRLTRDESVISGAYLLVDADQRDSLQAHLKNMPVVAGVASPASMLQSFQEQLADSLYIGIGFLVGFAGVIAVAVVYNGARIALSERGRELASLRVMGFRHREVTFILLGEQALVTLIAIPIGWGLGYLFALGIVTSMQTDAYRIPLIISGRTYALAAVLVALAAAASGAIVRHRLQHLDLISVLKTRE